MDAKIFIIGILIVAFIAALIAYGIWLKKGEKEDAAQATRNE